MSIPFKEIDTVFLDVGNTLISIDFDWVARELHARALTCGAETLRRAEAAARPGYARRLFAGQIPDGADLFRMYLADLLRSVEALASAPPDQFEALVTELRLVLRPDGRASALWRSVMPRVPEALERLQRKGLTLGVVSNSDGTVEKGLTEAGLRRFFDVVIDSAVVGYEKPDPRIFECAVARCGAKPERTLHVGDLYHADVLGARAAGLHALLLDPFGDWPPLDCDRVPDLWGVADQFD